MWYRLGRKQAEENQKTVSHTENLAVAKEPFLNLFSCLMQHL